MTWLFESQEITEIPEEYVGFVYMITNTISGKRYIGKKISKFSKITYRVVKFKNGTKKKKKIRSKIDSDWLTYYGSNETLKQDIASLGSQYFTREILHFCKSKAECSYKEAREQFERRVLETDGWYNGHIQVRVHGSHIRGKIT